MKHTRSRSALSVLAIGTVAVVLAVSPAFGLSSRPGLPGQPQAGQVVWSEDFESPTSPPERLDDYGGGLYTADPNWLPPVPPATTVAQGSCNGWVMNYHSTQPDPTTVDYGCERPGGVDGQGTTQIGWWFLEQMAWALGRAQSPAGTPDATDQLNYVVSAETNNGGTTGAAGLMFSTASDYIPATPGHYYVTSIWLAAAHCETTGHPQWVDAQLSLDLILDDGSNPPTSYNLASGFDPCNADGTVVQTMARNTPISTVEFVSSAMLVPPGIEYLGMSVSDATDTDTGNDLAFDTPMILDVTPQLDKDFELVSPFTTPTVVAGEPNTLTFTITNTDEVGEKRGWSFTDVLPTGLYIATPSNAWTDCPETPASDTDPIVPTTPATVTAAIGTDTITVASASLADGQDYCTVKVDVTSDVTGSYTNDDTNITSSVGLWLPSDTTLKVVEPPSLELTKTAQTTHYTSGGDPMVTAAGQIITYVFDIQNTGGVPIAHLALNDRGAYTDATHPGFTGTGTLGTPDCADVHLGGTLPAYDDGATDTTICTVQYTVTQEDMDSGGPILNTAVARGLPWGETDELYSNPDTAQVVVVDSPDLTLQKSVFPLGPFGDGDELDYSFVVTNSGNVTVNDIAINDGGAGGSCILPGVAPCFSGVNPLGTITCVPTTLAPGEQATCTATYIVQPDDDTVGEVYNTAEATGDYVDSASNTHQVISNLSDAQVPNTPLPALEMVKYHDDLTTLPASAGDTVTFRFQVTNTGNIPMSDISVADTMPGLSAVVCPPTDLVPLLPGQFLVCSATYDLTQDDIDDGEVHNEDAYATGTDDGGTTWTDSDPVDDTVVLVADPQVELIKSVQPNDQASFKVGQKLAYSFQVTNAGNVTLQPISVAETAFTGSGKMSQITCPAAPLAPTMSTICTATYTLTQHDVDSGKLDNTAVAKGLAPDGTAATSAPSTVRLSGPLSPSVDLVKTAQLSADKQQIEYSFVVTNTGNVTLRDVALTEDTFTGKGMPPVVTCPPGSDTLAPGESVTCTAAYRMVVADSGATIHNTAQVTATPLAGAVLSDQDKASITVGVIVATGGYAAGPDQLLNTLGLLCLLVAGAIAIVLRRLRTN